MGQKLVLFKTVVSKDAMQVVLPAGEKISRQIQDFEYEDICLYFKQLGYAVSIKEPVFEELKSISRGSSGKTNKDIVLLRGRPFMPARGDVLRFIKREKLPDDLVTAGVPFARLYKARAALPAVTVFGKEIQMSEEEASQQPGAPMELPNDVKIGPDGTLVSESGGQAKVNGNHLTINPFYLIERIVPGQYHHAHFPCSVEVKCELVGDLDWIIDNDLIAHDFWSASNIFVKGSVKCHGGVQTNRANDEDGTIQVMGDLEVNYIQGSRFFVGGSLKVAKSITNSHITVVKDLDCMGDPGRIAASEIEIQEGILKAKMIGSEKERPTYLAFGSEEVSRRSSIQSLGEGTRMRIGSSKFIIQSSQPWPTPRTK